MAVVTAAMLALVPIASAQSFEVLHTFTNVAVSPPVPVRPSALIQGADGNFYGTTDTGGAAHLGTIFRMTPSALVTVLHEFVGGSADGARPHGGLLQSTSGDFYGATAAGGGADLGTIFRITSTGSVTILHAFAGGSSDGADPEAALIQGTDGNFYGTTAAGGAANLGTVFRMTPGGSVTILHAFAGGNDGASPVAALLQATDGNFYGTTTAGGCGVAPVERCVVPPALEQQLHDVHRRAVGIERRRPDPQSEVACVGRGAGLKPCATGIMTASSYGVSGFSRTWSRSAS